MRAESHKQGRVAGRKDGAGVRNGRRIAEPIAAPAGPKARVLNGEQKLLAIDALNPYPGNPRRGDVAAIGKSLAANGVYRPVVVRRATMEIVCGNHVVEAARKAGLTEVPVYLIDISAEEAARIVVTDNRMGDLGGYDSSDLATLLAELDDLAGTGYVQADLDVLLDELGELAPFEDDLPPLTSSPVTQTGELIRLGAHALVCGDARDSRAYKRLFAGEQAALLHTDPPYGVEYRGKTKRKLELQNDTPAELAKLLSGAFAAADVMLAPGAALYVWHPAGPLAFPFHQAFTSAGWSLRQGLVWVKHPLVLGRCCYHYRHEPLLFGYKPGPERRGRGAAGWYGGNAQSTVFEAPRPRSSQAHPTMKPVEVIATCVRNSSRRGELVLDPFAGSGSTLIACEQLGRRARLIELEPAYCDVIVERFERLTGTKAQRERE